MTQLPAFPTTPSDVAGPDNTGAVSPVSPPKRGMRTEPPRSAMRSTSAVKHAQSEPVQRYRHRQGEELKREFALEAASEMLLSRSMYTEICRSGFLRVPVASRRSSQMSAVTPMPVVELADALPEWEKPKLTPSRLAVVALLNLVDCINMNLLTPYAAEMVSTLLDMPVNSPKVLQSVGLLIGLYNISEMFFSPVWGKLSDRVGRRPVILASLGGAALVPIAFGLSRSLLMALAVRALNGVLCGSFGITKTYVAELVEKENEAQAFGVLVACYSLGMIIGPMAGGLLVFPARWSPAAAEFFDRPVLRIFKDEPFLLPNLAFTVFACCVWLLAYFFLQESLPPVQLRRIAKAAAEARAAAEAEAGTDDLEQTQGCSWERVRSYMPFLSYPWNLLRAMASYGLVVGYLIATIQNIILLCQIPTSDSGFGLTPKTLGLLQNCAAAGLLVTQLFLYPKLVRWMGYRWCVAAGLCTVLAVTLPFPLYGMLADPDTFGAVRLLPLVFMLVVQQAAFGLCTPTTTVWINRFAEGLDRGEVNGWANSFAALIRALAPMVVGSLQALSAGWSWSGWRYLALYAISFMAVAIGWTLLPVLPGAAVSPQEAAVQATERQDDSDEAADSQGSKAPHQGGHV